MKKEGDASDFYDTLDRESKDAPWRLKKAWRSSDGHVVEEFPITE